MQSLTELESERLEWSLQTFTEATAVSSLRKLEGEIKEVEELLTVPTDADPFDWIAALSEEYADCLMCLFDSAGRAGISVELITAAFAAKMTKNKARKWAKNPDNSYSHVK
ncbi:dATP/dGTP pyrophosphohydrolase domain-containing protein [Fibrisoma montanum]|nr:dATP/dGTP pyrophosphohydrolase domain-containing protein [Fibrisoma montanum]